MITEPIDLCRACGRIRGDLSMLCASCMRMAMAAPLEGADYYDEADRYRMQNTMDGDRERMDSVRDSFRRGYE